MAESSYEKALLLQMQALIDLRASSDTPAESQQLEEILSQPTGENIEADQILQLILTTLPPIEQWSSATVESLRSAICENTSEAVFQNESEWTRRLINVILRPNEGWTSQKLKTCSNAEYFSLSTHTIMLLNALFYANCFHAAEARCDAGDYDAPLSLDPINGAIGYPIFRTDYTNDERFELYKTCWEQFLKKEFYMPEALFPEDVEWFWIDDKEGLERKGPRQLRKFYERLRDKQSLPFRPEHYWLILVVDSTAMESLLRVYGPPATLIFDQNRNKNAKRSVPFALYFIAVSTRFEDVKVDKKAYSENNEWKSQSINEDYPGYIKCAIESMFALWQMDPREVDKFYPRDGNIWVDLNCVYEAPSCI